AANGTVTVPVDLRIVPKAEPLIYYQGVQNNATFAPGESVAQGDILALKGEQLSFSAPALNLPIPLPASAGATSVLVNGKAVPLFYTSYGQIAFQLPYDVPVGTALVQVKRDDDDPSNSISIHVMAAAPRLVVLTYGDYSLNTPAHPAHGGDSLILWTIGFGQTSPAAVAGTAAPGTEPLARVPGVTVNFGNGPFSTV